MDIATLLQANLELVFGERDAIMRLAAIREIYADDAHFNEPDRSVRGHDAISKAVSELLDRLPQEFVFTAIRPATGHNGVGRLQWQARPPGGPVAVTGTDVVHVEGGRIRTLHVFIDQTDV